jgi:cytochrome c
MVAARFVLAGLVLALVPTAISSAAAAQSPVRILVFSKTAAFRHDSIPAGIRAIRELAGARRIRVDATENGAAFTTRNLRRYRAVVFLSTTGDVLTRAQQQAFQRYVRGGGGFAGVHAAADTEYGWPWYGHLVGARFRSHPNVQPAIIRVRTTSHPSTAGLPKLWLRTDEWYNFASLPPRGTRILATLDETSYAPGEGSMGSVHPIAWAHTLLGGRSWYTGGGHTAESYAEPRFRRHLIGGIRWAARLTGPSA